MWYDPFEEMKRFQRYINRFFESFGYLPTGRELIAPERVTTFREPLADIEDKGNEVVVTLELPGIEKEDIELNVTEDEVSVKVERKEKAVEKRKGFYRAERMYKGFYRSLKLPTKVMPEKATASYKDGLLEIRLPKTEKAKKSKKIKIK
jgi:HSP20 family protein